MSVSCGKALDGNQDAMRDRSHPRIFLYAPNHQARNHQWELRHVEGEYYNIVNCANGKGIDGNESVSQHQHNYPVPFLWQPERGSHNHQWRFDKVDKKTYLIINRQTGKGLDANFTACSQADNNLPSPFMWTPSRNSPNHQWKLHQQY